MSDRDTRSRRDAGALGRARETIPSESVDDYLKAIHELEETSTRATTSILAKRLGVTPASVTGMLRKLAEAEPSLVDYRKHHGARLTEHGRRRALEVLRHHRLIETFLHDTLGYSWDEVHAEAERLEHAISETFEERIAKQMGDPEVDPHGHSIPRKDGTLPDRAAETRLAELPSGGSGVVSCVNDEDPALLRYLADLGLRLGVRVTIVSRAPFDGPIIVRVDEATDARPVSRRVAAQVLVSHVV